MIRVLQDWHEIGEASKFLAMQEFHRHKVCEKCWDFQLLCDLVENLDRKAKIIDLGCSGVDTLKLLYGMGFENLTGVDLIVGARDRISQALRMWRKHTLRKPFRLYKQDLTRTSFADAMFDMATCISVIEHGVDFDKFLAEASRLLKVDGQLFVTADYWEKRIEVQDGVLEFGLPWSILCREDVEEIVSAAERYGLIPLKDNVIPKCGEQCVVWHRKEYTFVAMVFKKKQAGY